MSVPPAVFHARTSAVRPVPERSGDVLSRALERIHARSDRTSDSRRLAEESPDAIGRLAPPRAARIADGEIGAVDARKAAAATRGADSTDLASSSESSPPNRESESPDASGADRRAVPRHASGYSVLVRHLRTGSAQSCLDTAWAWHGAPERGKLLDVSLSGLACLMEQPLERGQQIDVQLWNPRRDVRLERTASVLRCLPAGPDRWKVVCRFAAPLGMDDLQWVAQHLLPHPVV